MGADSLKSTPETENHVLRAEYIDPIDVAPHQGHSAYESLLAVEGTPSYS